MAQSVSTSYLGTALESQEGLKGQLYVESYVVSSETARISRRVESAGQQPSGNRTPQTTPRISRRVESYPHDSTPSSKPNREGLESQEGLKDRPRGGLAGAVRRRAG